MARRRTPLHRLTLRNHHGAAVCKWQGREWRFGPWDALRDAPSPAALTAFQQQVARWMVEPTAGLLFADEETLFELWADWLESESAPADRREERTRCTLALFGRDGEPGPHRNTTLAEFGGPQLAAWRDHLCMLTKPDGADGVMKRLGRYTVSRYVALVKACVKWAEERGRIGEDRTAALLRVGPPPKHLSARPRNGRRSPANWLRWRSRSSRPRCGR
jgi:hypothetical protein